MKLTISETDKKGIVRIQLEFEGPVEWLQSISMNTNLDHPKLTRREEEVLDYLLQGKPSKQIAELLFISPHTVKNHIQKIYEKYQIHSRAELFKILTPFAFTNK